MFIRVIQNDCAYNSALLSSHLTTSVLPPRKTIFVIPNVRLQNLKEGFKKQTLILNENQERIMPLIEISSFSFSLDSVLFAYLNEFFDQICLHATRHYP